MDAFDGFLQKVMAMDEAGRAAMISEQRVRCTCDSCPTYNECMREKGELVYCIAGRSPTCTFEKRGCICPTCPVKAALGLSRAYYCIRGSEQEQRNVPPQPKTP